MRHTRDTGTTLAPATGAVRTTGARGELITRLRTPDAVSPSAEPNSAAATACASKKRAMQRSSAPSALSVPNSRARSVTEAYNVCATTARPTSSPSTAARPKLMPMPVRVSQ